MKLTNATRESFIDSVMKGIPVVNKFDIDDTMMKIRGKVEAALPKDILEFATKYPNLIKREKRLRFEILNSCGRWNVNTVNVIDHESCVPIGVTDYVILQKRNLDEQIERKVIRQRISDVTYSCTTLAKLKVALPELESYMPAEREVVKNLPIATGGLITDLLNIGLKVPK